MYGYSLVTMEFTRRSFTNVETASPTNAPMGQFANMQNYPAVDDHRVTAPNADTLYSTAWIDVTKEPYVFSIPDMNGRYFLMPMLDGFTNVFQVPGSRTTGTGAQKYLITGPGWNGTVPQGVTQYKSQTGLVWILGRIYCTGTPEDYAAVHALQAQLSLVPLSAYGRPYTPPAGTVDPSFNQSGSVRDQVEALTPEQYFSLLGDLLKTNPPEMPQDAAIVAEMKQLGLTPGESWNVGALSADAQAAIAAAKPAAVAQIKAFATHGGLEMVNGWGILRKTGLYGDDYLDRAFVTAVGLGANRPEDAIYPFTQASFDGAKTYVITFAKGQQPPVKGFWSITMYDPQYFFVPNALNKQSISPRQNFATEPDGSVVLYFSNKQPAGVPASNWLPAPPGKFLLMMRNYWPDPTPPSLLDGTWKPPVVQEKGS
ncbi:MAG TPA: DUF1254 domain-containing protein [Candidatus Binatia bacterium]|nr:DUF1254 domain-containing protein [Candidatus Binatia bacterium]